MKKTFLLTILLTLLVEIGYSQITIQANPATISGYDFSGTWDLSTWTGYYTKDAGTNAYVYSGSGGGIDNAYMILRQNNKWLFLQQLNISGSGTYLTTKFAAITYSNEIDPPCNDIWEVHQGSTARTGSNLIANLAPQNEFFELTLSGNTCTQVLHSSSFEAHPNLVQMPLISPTEMGNIPNPMMGMVTFDRVGKTMKQFDGLNWNPVYNYQSDFNSFGNISVPENSKVIFGQDANSNKNYIKSFNNATAGHAYALYSNNQPRMIVANSGNITVTGLLNNGGTSNFEVKGSQGINTQLTNGDLVLNNSMHNVFYTGSGSHTFTLPDPTTVLNREYYLTNHSAGILNFSLNITIGQGVTINSLSQQESVHIVSDGVVWRRIN